ncbi:MAG: SagB/ThcOx family dehydrogenase [Chloroflexota bacterium]|nr:SagB/ThcOx family dehydrogenase [Chloroflexota bacterium]
MSNRDIQATWHYHNGTKHPGGYLLDPWHTYDPADRPLLFKICEDLEAIPLPLDTTAIGMPALEAIATTVTPDGERVPDIGTLARILHFSAGITKRISYPPPYGEMLFRAASCTGALYHIELYAVCGTLPGLAAGVYHFDPRENALRQLRDGDYRRLLIEASGQEPYVAQAPLILIYTDVFWRNAVKYQAREYRHAFWDSGTILAHSLAISTNHGLPAKVVTGFVDAEVNRLLDLDTQHEVTLELLPIGHVPDAPPAELPAVEPLSLETVPIAEEEHELPAILAMHEASTLQDPSEVAAWRGEPPTMELPPAQGQLFSLDPYNEMEMPQDALEPVIARRGSTRQFARESITFRQLSTILERAMQGLPADFLEGPDSTLNHLYLIVHAVEGLPSGKYVFHSQQAALELLEVGDFRAEAGHLGLGQALAADASVTIFFLSDLKPVLDRFGNRGYRAVQLEASIRAGKIYLAAYAQQLGATGLTFYDDAVTTFFSPHAADKSVMFLVLVGKPT